MLPVQLMSAESENTVGLVETTLLTLELPEGGLTLDSGAVLPEVVVAYETYGERAPDDSNVVFVCHALSGDAHAAGRHADEHPDDPGPWWEGMIGPGKGIDTRHYHVICANVLGGCKGTTGPMSIDPRTGRPYAASFPEITVGDIVTVHHLLIRQLGISKLAAVIGGSFGGMQALEWAVRFPDSVEHCICIASAASLSAQALAFDVVARKAIQFDPDWQEGNYYDTGRKPDRGLSLARKVGHITYLSPEIMTRKFGRVRWDKGALNTGSIEINTEDGPDGRAKFHVQTYLEYQGEKFTRRFDANSYLHISRAMDEYDLVASYGSLEEAFKRVRARMTVIALSSDWLFPPEQSRDVANGLLHAGRQVTYCELQAPHGHDAFLVDIDPLSHVIRAVLPWVGREREPARTPPASRPDFGVIAGMVKPGSRVLDLGAGNGDLLSVLAAENEVRGLGIDIELDHLIEMIDRGHDVFQADLDAGLAMIPDAMYDYAVLGETLQIIRRPGFVLREMLRVAREGIVSFPNLGYWRHRARLAISGRIAKQGSPSLAPGLNETLHSFTLRDVAALCEESGIRIVRQVGLSSDPLGRLLVKMGFLNLGAAHIVIKTERLRPDATGK